MKKISYLLLVLLILAACKKDGSGDGSGKMLLSKVFMNGLLESEYIYSIDGKLIRYNFYLAGGGLSTLLSYQIFEYNDDGTISQMYQFSKEYQPTSRRVYSYSAQGKVTRIDEASIFTGDDNLSHMDYFEVYTYDGAGRLTTETRRLTNYAMHSRTDYTYDDKGYVSDYKYFSNDNGTMVMKQHMELEPGAKPMPDHWKEMLIAPTDMQLFNLFVPGYKYTSYYGNPAGTITTWSFSDRQYNNKGYVIKQTVQTKTGGTVNVNERTYEYVQ